MIKLFLGVIRASAVMIRYEGFPTPPREAAKRQVFRASSVRPTYVSIRCVGTASQLCLGLSACFGGRMALAFLKKNMDTCFKSSEEIDSVKPSLAKLPDLRMRQGVYLEDEAIRCWRSPES